MISSLDLLNSTGISRATLNNYIAMGLLPKPIVKRESPSPGLSPTTLGYFPKESIARVQTILTMKKQGLLMEEIKMKLANDLSMLGKKPLQHISHENKYNKINIDHKVNNLNSSDLSLNSQAPSLEVTIDDIPYPAFMMNYEFQLVWLNESSRQLLFPDTTIPDRAHDRSLLPVIFNWIKEVAEEAQKKFFKAHFQLMKERLLDDTFHQLISQYSSLVPPWLKDVYHESAATEEQMMLNIPFQKDGTLYQLYIIRFREGLLTLFVPEKENTQDLLHWLGKRDVVIQKLLTERLPVLTPLAVMVADLQQSVRICAELPPEEYFELINDIWRTLDPILRQYYGTYGKHTGDGMVYYFFPQPDRNYLMNAIECAAKIQSTMKVLNQKWALKKQWTNQLYMNIGLNEGEEWLGTFKTNLTYELVVLGETINTGGRLSDLARFGQIWATKHLVSKLTAEEKNRLIYGVERRGMDQSIFVPKSFAQVDSLINENNQKLNKLMDIASTAVTEIKEVKDHITKIQ